MFKLSKLRSMTRIGVVAFVVSVACQAEENPSQEIPKKTAVRNPEEARMIEAAESTKEPTIPATQVEGKVEAQGAETLPQTLEEAKSDERVAHKEYKSAYDSNRYHKEAADLSPNDPIRQQYAEAADARLRVAHKQWQEAKAAVTQFKTAADIQPPNAVLTEQTPIPLSPEEKIHQRAAARVAEAEQARIKLEEDLARQMALEKAAATPGKKPKIPVEVKVTQPPEIPPEILALNTSVKALETEVEKIRAEVFMGRKVSADDVARLFEEARALEKETGETLQSLKRSNPNWETVRNARDAVSVAQVKLKPIVDRIQPSSPEEIARRAATKKAAELRAEQSSKSTPPKNNNAGAGPNGGGDRKPIDPPQRQSFPEGITNPSNVNVFESNLVKTKPSKFLRNAHYAGKVMFFGAIGATAWSMANGTPANAKTEMANLGVVFFTPVGSLDPFGIWSSPIGEAAVAVVDDFSDIAGAAYNGKLPGKPVYSLPQDLGMRAPKNFFETQPIPLAVFYAGDKIATYLNPLKKALADELTDLGDSLSKEWKNIGPTVAYVNSMSPEQLAQIMATLEATRPQATAILIPPSSPTQPSFPKQETKTASLPSIQVPIIPALPSQENGLDYVTKGSSYHLSPDGLYHPAQ